MHFQPMQNLLAFLITTVLFIIAGNGIVKIFFEMIQDGGALDVLFGWQKMLAKLYAKEKKTSQLLEKMLGGCERCFSFWFMPTWFFTYCLTSKYAFHMWVTDAITHSGFWHWALICFVNWTWYCLFHAVGAQGGYFLLSKFKKKSNVV